MTEDDVLAKVKVMAQEVFSREDLDFTPQTTAEHIDEWDSITHMQLIIMVEREFKMRFTARDLAKLDQVQDLLDVVLAKAKV